MAKPYLGKKEEDYVLRVLRSGQLSIGPYLEKFEKEFAKRAGTRYACGVSSGTAGLHLALIAAGVGPGDEVITSPLSFIASANAALYIGAVPVFADIDPHTYNINPDEIEKKITTRTKAIMPVHIFGQPAAMEKIMQLAAKHNLAVVEDACESLEATYRGQKTGTFGLAGVFAFYPNKQMTTGEGGMIVTNSERVDALCRSLRNQGRSANLQWLDHAQLGYNYRLDEMSAAVGLAQIENIDFLIQKRQELAAWYTEVLEPLSKYIELPHTGPDATHTWFVYVVRIKNQHIKRNEVIAALAKEGVSSKPYLPAIHLFEFYQKFGHRRGEFPIAERAGDSTFALPFYIGLTKADVRQIAGMLEKVFKKYEKYFY